MEHEEFLTPDDFRGEIIDKGDLDVINGHPEGDEDNIEFNEIFPDDERDEDVRGTTPTGLPMYKNTDVEDMYGPKGSREKDPMMDLRERQFLRIKEVQEEMKKSKDNRHLFLIKKGCLMESPEGFKFWRGNLQQDVLAVKGKRGLELKSLIPSGEIKISHPNDKSRVWNIPHTNARHKGIPKIDLTESKINSGRELYVALLPKEK